MKKNVMIAPVGENPDSIFVGVKEFPTERVVLLATNNRINEAEQLKKDLERFRIPAEIKKLEGNIWESLFRAVGEIKAVEGDDRLIMNVAPGDPGTSCMSLCAAFVNGIKAVEVKGDDVIMLPILKFSYYKSLTNKKLDIIRLINDDVQCCSSLDELSKKTGMSLPLISYHVNGNLKSDGLKDLGLVETVESKGKTSIALTTMGRLLVRGYVEAEVA